MRCQRMANALVDVVTVAVVVVVAVALVDSQSVHAEQEKLEPSAPVRAEEEQRQQQQQPAKEAELAPSEGLLDLNYINRNLFKELFVARRKEHLQAVKNLKGMNNYERQYKIINIISGKIFDVIESKKGLLEDLTDAKLANVSFAAEANTKNDLKDAMSSVLENTAFFGDLVLNLPDVTRRVLESEPRWNATIHWSFDFFNKTRDWIDESTLDMMNLVLQELNIVERQANYVNPNRIGKSTKPVPSKKKEKLKKGPMITKVDL